MLNHKKKWLCSAVVVCAGFISLSAAAVVYQAEDYSAAFDKTKGNVGGVYKTGDVDIESTSDTGGGYNVGWIDATEWLKYSNFSVTTTGDYIVNARVASASGGSFALDLNAGAIKLADVTVPATGGWQKWATVSTTVRLTAGKYDLGVYASSGGWNFNWIEIVPKDNGCGQTTPYSGAPILLPGRVEAENYDKGCAGTAYSDKDAANVGGLYRQDAVDIEATSDLGGGHNIGWTESGEWLKYTVDVTKAGSYILKARMASGGTGGKLSVAVDGVDLAGEFVVANTGGWQSWRDAQIGPVSLSAGRHSLVVKVVQGGVNLNFIDVADANVTPIPTGPLYADASKGEWTLVVVPDTQHYSQNRANAPIAHMHKAFDWIVSVKGQLNIQFVQGLGDITESWDQRWEWDNASTAWYKLQGQVPHMPIVGNHDSPATMNQYFSRSYYSRESWYGGDFGGIENNYALLTIGREQYMFLHVQAHDQYSKPPASALAWAKQVLAANPRKKVILATHDLWATQTIKNNLLTKYDNIVLANAGHDCVREATYVTTGPNGGVSNNFIADFQCDAQEVMLLRYYVFKPLEDKVYYYTYSPITQKFEQDASSQGSFTLVQIDP